MESPFSFGQVVSGTSFTNRTLELKQISDLLRSRNHAILISPRRYGKSSLVKVALMELANEGEIRVTSLDLTAARSEEEFLEHFANQILRTNSSSSPWKRFGEVIKTITPSFTFGMADFTDLISLTFNWAERKKTTEEILNLPALMAEITGLKQVVAIDEFQNISRFEDSEGLQYQMRSYWQHHVDVSYCLYGSKRHMMEEIFSSDSSPFYNFGQVIKLQKISIEHWLPFIRDKFQATGKRISDGYTRAIVAIMNNHSEYIQILCHHIWTSCDQAEVSEKHMIQGFRVFMDTTSIHFLDQYDKLNNSQVKTLKAILLEERQLTSVEVIQKYGLGTSANVIKARRLLIEDDVVEKTNDGYSVISPAMELWFRARVLNESILPRFREKFLDLK